MKKINFQDLPNTDTPIKASILNTMQSNIEESCVAVSPTQPETNEKVWIQKRKNLFNIYNNNYVTGTNNASIKTINSRNSFILRISGAYGRVGCTIKGLVPNANYVISTSVSNGNANTCGLYISSENNYTKTDTSFTATLIGRANADGELYFEFYGNRTNVNLKNTVTFNNIQIEQGSTATEYEAYVEPKIWCKNDNGVFEEFYKQEEKKEYTISNLPEHSAGTNNFKLTKIGKIIILNVDVLWVNSTAKDTWISLGNIPSEICPSSNISNATTISRGDTGAVIGYGKVIVEVNGNLKVKVNTDCSNLSSFNFELIWFL